MAKRPPNNWDYSKLEFFERKDESVIQNLAPGMEMNEALEYFDVTPAELSEYDTQFFRVTFKRGRLIAKQNAISSVFSQMNGASGLSAALNYLSRFGNEAWKADAAGSVKVPKEIKVVFDE